MSVPHFDVLDKAGLNLQAVFDVATLPAEIAAGIPPLEGGRSASRLVLIGHGGRRLWSAIMAAGVSSDDPIDDYSTSTVEAWFAGHFPGYGYRRLYPGDEAPGLQHLGLLAGWHHSSPFMVGIRPEWGTWFAYRVLFATDAPIAPTPRLTLRSPCESCSGKPCIGACPGKAMADGRFELGRCVDFRVAAHSPCARTCLAREACPVGGQHRYAAEQIHHTYAISLQAIRTWRLQARRAEQAHAPASQT